MRIKHTIQKLKNNWFQVIVILLLLLCYLRLGDIEENTFLTADMLDSKIQELKSTTEDYLHKIEGNTENTWQILEDKLN